MSNPDNFSQRKDDLYLVDRFREPYSLLETMFCRLYSLPNCSYFKAEWVLITHHILTIGESLPWVYIISLELKTTIQDYKKSTAKKKPNFFFLAVIVDVFCAEFHYPNLGWNWILPAPPVHIYHA